MRIKLIFLLRFSVSKMLSQVNSVPIPGQVVTGAVISSTIEEGHEGPSSIGPLEIGDINLFFTIKSSARSPFVK